MKNFKNNSSRYIIHLKTPPWATIKYARLPPSYTGIETSSIFYQTPVRAYFERTICFTIHPTAIVIINSSKNDWRIFNIFRSSIRMGSYEWRRNAYRRFYWRILPLILYGLCTSKHPKDRSSNTTSIPICKPLSLFYRRGIQITLK